MGEYHPLIWSPAILPSQPAQSAGRSPSRSASQIVSDGVLGALEEGRYSPGQRLVVADLAIRFGVGPNAVREALQRLAAEGVVELSRHRGAMIRELAPEQALMTLELTELLIGLAARTAARNIADPAAAAKVEHALERLKASGSADDMRAFLKARNAFFGALLTAGGNQELERISPTVQLRVLRAQYHLANTYRRLSRDLAAIGQAVLAGDPQAAEEAAQAHVGRIRQALQRELDAQEETDGGL
jgi:DNA-binding GntR family transcriptional regulator